MFGFSEAALGGVRAEPHPTGQHGVEPHPTGHPTGLHLAESHPAVEVTPFTRLLADLVPAGFMLLQVGINLVRLAGMG